ncbi:MAG TPA: hypothetical protein VE968_02590, partial [Sphingomicrobium sp.]|nr:hypothetical protein [Sphingomicrobium sp.]
LGQWTAFRKWAADDAVMFTPKPVWAKTFLKALKDPPRSISWRAEQTFSSCDGRTAVNIGPWFNQDHQLAGYFTTVWQRTTAAGWRWVYDGGVPIRKNSHQNVEKSQRASCNVPDQRLPMRISAALDRTASMTSAQNSGRGYSADKTLGWEWKVGLGGERTLRVYLWTGNRYDEVIHAIDPAREPR